MMENTLELTATHINYTITEETVRRLRERPSAQPIIGQDRAIHALNLGLGIEADGYNIFIMGASGTGRRTVLGQLLENYKANPANLQDIAYVCNFNRPLEPRAIFFPAGGGAYFKKTLKSAIESIRRQSMQISKSEVFSAASKKIASTYDQEENRLLGEFEGEMYNSGFSLIQVKDNEARSMDLVPLWKGKPVSFEELQEKVSSGKVPAENVGALRERYYEGLDKMAELFSQIRDLRRAMDKRIRALKAQSAEPIIENELAVLRSLCKNGPDYAEALEFLDALKTDLISRVHQYSEPFKSPAHKRNFFGRYAINLICEHSGSEKNIVHEEVPTFANLFGSIEPSGPNDDMTVNGHLRIRSGAVHRAFGGILILRLQDLLMEDGAWPYLKRVLQSGLVEIQTPPTGNHLPSLLKPKVLKAKLKVVIIGGEHSYDFLYQEDPDFQKLFKVCAEFDSVMPATEDNMASLITFITDFTRKTGTLPIDDGGIARIIAHAARLTDYRTLLTTRFTKISDLIIETDYQARKAGQTTITGETVSHAIENRRYLQRLPEEKYAQTITSREMVIDVSGSSIGKVNGLAVLDRGYHAFGIPVAVSAQASPGTKGVVNIERESGLSGEIYDKAHLIIQGLLRGKYAQDFPLALSASICFEQSYTEVDGDSASCAEFFALISAIARLPLRQDIAVTGSLNQLGDVQPVGGITEKIEGFFDTCSLLGLTGTQGVIIPRRNLPNVLPSDRLLTAVQDGLFHIWAIDTIDEGLFLLSGMSPVDFGKTVAQNLLAFTEHLKDFYR